LLGTEGDVDDGGPAPLGASHDGACGVVLDWVDPDGCDFVMFASLPLRRGVEFAVAGATGGFLSSDERCSVPALDPCSGMVFDSPLLADLLDLSIVVGSNQTHVSGVLGEKVGAAALSLAAPEFVGRAEGNFGVAAVVLSFAPSLTTSLSPYYLLAEVYEH
jgi:hypothetical protein